MGLCSGRALYRGFWHILGAKHILTYLRSLSLSSERRHWKHRRGSGVWGKLPTLGFEVQTSLGVLFWTQWEYHPGNCLFNEDFLIELLLLWKGTSNPSQICSPTSCMILCIDYPPYIFWLIITITMDVEASWWPYWWNYILERKNNMASNKKNCTEIQNLAQENTSSEGSKQNGRVWIWGGGQERKVCVECELNSLRLFSDRIWSRTWRFSLSSL